jgi:hypothetical protein
MVVTGPIRIEVLPKPAADFPHAELARFLDDFVRALALDMFAAGKLLAETVSAPAAHQRTFTVQGVPSHAFRVLDGMLRYFHAVIAPLDSWVAVAAADPRRSLFTDAEPVPPVTDPPPIPTTGSMASERVAPPLTVELEFARAVPEAEREQMIEDVGAWHALLQGGYPARDFGAGESGTSQPSIRFSHPALLHYHVDFWQADASCFVPLYNLMQRWRAQGRSVIGVELE